MVRREFLFRTLASASYLLFESACGSETTSNGGIETASAEVVSVTLPTATPTAASSLAGTFPVLPPAMLGINESFLYGPTDWCRDLALRADWRSPGYSLESNGNFNLTAIGGFPTTYPQGATQFILGLPNLTRSEARAGVYTVTYPPSMTVKLNALNSGITQAQAFSNGTGKLNMPATMQPGGGALIFSGPIPPGGIAISITKDGDTNTGIYTGEAASSLAALGKINRSMTVRGINSPKFIITPDNLNYVQQSAADRYRGAATMGPMCIEFQVDACNKANQHLWYNCSHIDSDNFIAAEAAVIASQLKSDRAVFVELSNETWNTGFDQTRQMKWMGVRDGFGPPDASPSTLVPENIIYNSLNNQSTTNFALNVGDKIFMAISGVGWLVVQANAAMPAGSTVTVTNGQAMGTNTTDGNWKLVYDNSATSRAADRWYARRSKQIWNIVDAALTAAGRPRSVHVIGWWAIAGIHAGNAPKLDWDDTYLAADRVAIAPYWGAGVGAQPNDLGTYADQGTYIKNYSSPPYAHPWTATQKDLVATDPNGFIDAFFAIAPDAVDTAIGAVQQRVSELAAYLSVKGRSAGSIKISSYEANWHVLFGGYPTADQAGWSANGGVHRQIMRDSRFGDMVTRYFSKLVAFGAEHCAFDRCGGSITTYPNGNTSWAFQEYDADHPPRYTALAALNAATG